jgi:hypothetical protein
MSIVAYHLADLCEMDGGWNQEREWLVRNEHHSDMDNMVFLCTHPHIAYINCQHQQNILGLNFFGTFPSHASIMSTF